MVGRGDGGAVEIELLIFIGNNYSLWLKALPPLVESIRGCATVRAVIRFRARLARLAFRVQAWKDLHNSHLAPGKVEPRWNQGGTKVDLNTGGQIRQVLMVGVGST